MHYLISLLFVLRVESNDAEGSKQLKYKCNTTKTLEMSRVFLVEKGREKEKEREKENEMEKEKEQVRKTFN